MLYKYKYIRTRKDGTVVLREYDIVKLQYTRHLKCSAIYFYNRFIWDNNFYHYRGDHEKI